MSILIKGMAIPIGCLECPMLSHFHCIPMDEDIPFDTGIRDKPYWCPIVPIPAEHGRLGDLDAIVKRLEEMEADFEKKEFYQGACWFHVIAELLKKAPTVVPSEGGREDG